MAYQDLDNEKKIGEKPNNYQITPNIGQSMTIFIGFTTAAICVMWFASLD